MLYPSATEWPDDLEPHIRTLLTVGSGPQTQTWVLGRIFENPQPEVAGPAWCGPREDKLVGLALAILRYHFDTTLRRSIFGLRIRLHQASLVIARPPRQPDKSAQAYPFLPLGLPSTSPPIGEALADDAGNGLLHTFGVVDAER